MGGTAMPPGQYPGTFNHFAVGSKNIAPGGSFVNQATSSTGFNFDSGSLDRNRAN